MVSPAAVLKLFAQLFAREAARGLIRNTLRSVLAAVGITIGIAAVVCVAAIGRAGSLRAEEQLHNLGDNLVWVEAGSRSPSGVRTGSHGTTSLTPEDAVAISQLPQIKAVSPQVDGSAQVVLGNRNWRTRWRGESAAYFDIKRWPVALGAPYGDDDVKHARSVVVIGQTPREKLFDAGVDPLGQVIRIDAQLFEVVGVLSVKGQSATGQDQDDAVIIPWTTAQKKLLGRGHTWLDDVFCSAVSAQETNEAAEEIKWLMRQRHHIRQGQEDDFNIRKPEEVIKAQIETSNTLSVLLLSIAAISLVVGGIGVMNVMLVSVAERTREIGLRLAVGASGLMVQLQFLGEAVLLGFFGGVLGLALGVGASYGIGSALGWTMSIPPEALVIAPLFSLAVGLLFGFYPARLASRLDPIDALRHE